MKRNGMGSVKAAVEGEASASGGRANRLGADERRLR